MKKRVLIIDDEPDVVAYLQTVLEANDYEVRHIGDALQGLDNVREFKPDLICLDIMMPRETGLSFYQRLRRHKKFERIPVMIISGASPDGEFDVKSFVTDENISPPDYYMEKPIDVDNFIDQVEKLIASGASAKSG